MVFIRAFRRYSYLSRLIAMAILVLVTVAILFSSLVMNRTIHSIQQQNHEYQLSISHTFSDYFNEQIELMWNKIHKLSYDNRLRQEYVETHVYNEMTAIEALKEYNMGIPIANEVALYYSGADYIVSSKYRYSYEFFVDSISSKDESPLRNQLIDFLNNASLHSRSIFSTFDSPYTNKVIIIAMNNAMSIRTSLRNVSVLYIITTDTLDTSFLGTLESKERGLAILDKNGIVYNNEILDGHKSVLSTLRMDDNGKYTYSINGTDYLAYVWNDKASDMKYITVISSERFEQSNIEYVKTVQRMLWLAFGVLLVTLIITIYINYIPVRKITKFVAEDKYNLNEMGELQSVQCAIETLGKHNEFMNTTIEEQRKVLMECIVGCLLNGIPIKPDIVANLNHYLAGEKYYLLTVAGLKLTHSSRELLMEQFCDNSTTIFIADALYDNYSIFICCVMNDIDFDLFIQKLFTAVQPYASESVSMGVGSRADCLVDLNISYMNAISAMRKGTGVVYYDNLIDNYSGINNLTPEMLMFFFGYIENGDKENALAKLEQIRNSVIPDCDSVVYERFICCELLNEFIKALAGMQHPLSHQNINRLMNFSNINDLCNNISTVTSQVCDMIAHHKKDMDEKFRNSVLNYVDEHYAENNISLICAADSFGVSIYTFSRLFKEIAGMGFREYIALKRIEMGYRLLVTTDFSVREISEKVGYARTDHFTKLFKNHYNMLPSEVRRNNSSMN